MSFAFFDTKWTVRNREVTYYKQLRLSQWDSIIATNTVNVY